VLAGSFRSDGKGRGRPTSTGISGASAEARFLDSSAVLAVLDAVVMERLKARTAFTFDRPFAQYDFEMVP